MIRHGRRKTDSDSLVFFEVSEANKGELVSDEGLRFGERLHVAFVIFNLVEVTGVYVTAQLRDHGGHR